MTLDEAIDHAKKKLLNWRQNVNILALESISNLQIGWKN